MHAAFSVDACASPPRQKLVDPVAGVIGDADEGAGGARFGIEAVKLGCLGDGAENGSLSLSDINCTTVAIATAISSSSMFEFGHGKPLSATPGQSRSIWSGTETPEFCPEWRTPCAREEPGVYNTFPTHPQLDALSSVQRLGVGIASSAATV